jgi:hypothetical protein
VEIELRVVNHPKPKTHPQKKQKTNIKQTKQCFGDYLDLGMFRLVWKTLFFFWFLWAFDSLGLIQIDPDYIVQTKSDSSCLQGILVK